MILGLDISSNVIGVTCLKESGELYFCSYIDLRTTTKASKIKFQDLFDKIAYAVKWLEDFKQREFKITISAIHIEEPLSKFKPGLSSIHTLSILFKMNYALSYELFRIFGLKPIYWHPSTVRKDNGLKMSKDFDAKELVFQHACLLFPEFKSMIPSNLPKSNPWIDVADSLLIARMGVLHGTSNIHS